MSEEFYLNRLYPLQDAILAIIAELDTVFYLTGGTALGNWIDIFDDAKNNDTWIDELKNCSAN